MNIVSTDETYSAIRYDISNQVEVFIDSSFDTQITYRAGDFVTLGVGWSMVDHHGRFAGYGVSGLKPISTDHTVKNELTGILHFFEVMESHFPDKYNSQTKFIIRNDNKKLMWLLSEIKKGTSFNLDASLNFITKAIGGLEHKVRNMVENFNVEFQWIKGHVDNHFNNLADFLARRCFQYGRKNLMFTGVRRMKTIKSAIYQMHRKTNNFYNKIEIPDSAIEPFLSDNSEGTNLSLNTKENPSLNESASNLSKDIKSDGQALKMPKIPVASATSMGLAFAGYEDKLSLLWEELNHKNPSVEYQEKDQSHKATIEIFQNNLGKTQAQTDLRKVISQKTLYATLRQDIFEEVEVFISSSFDSKAPFIPDRTSLAVGWTMFNNQYQFSGYGVSSIIPRKSATFSAPRAELYGILHFFSTLETHFSNEYDANTKFIIQSSNLELTEFFRKLRKYGGENFNPKLFSAFHYVANKEQIDKILSLNVEFEWVKYDVKNSFDNFAEDLAFRCFKTYQHNEKFMGDLRISHINESLKNLHSSVK